MNTSQKNKPVLFKKGWSYLLVLSMLLLGAVASVAFSTPTYAASNPLTSVTWKVQNAVKPLRSVSPNISFYNFCSDNSYVTIGGGNVTVIPTATCVPAVSSLIIFEYVYISSGGTWNYGGGTEAGCTACGYAENSTIVHVGTGRFIMVQSWGDACNAVGCSHSVTKYSYYYT